MITLNRLKLFGCVGLVTLSFTEGLNIGRNQILLTRTRMCVILDSMSSQPRPHWTEAVRRRRELSPRLKMAIRLYTTAAVPTKAEAARAVGLSPATLYIATSPRMNDAQVVQLQQTTDELIQDRSIDVSVLIEKLSRRGIEVMGSLMEHSGKDEVRLSAARDLADRGKRTAKITKFQVEPAMLDQNQADVLATALVRAAAARRAGAEAATGDYIKVDMETAVPEPQLALPMPVDESTAEVLGEEEDDTVPR